MKPNEATYISLKAKLGKESELANFLISGGATVEDTEPQTLLWFALRLDDSTFGIFDCFPDESARSAHFSGKVAIALNEKAVELIHGGWEEGVLKNVHNSKILTCKLPSSTPHSIQEATFIQLKANPGKEAKLANFLSKGGALVEETEPETCYWFALQFNPNTFGIFDFFADDNGRKKHFAGKVAKALQENASDLVEGGWQQGVLANVQNFKVMTSKLCTMSL